MQPETQAPLILTLRLDEASAGYFDGLRQRHFPPERNHLKAHVTVFHKLPGEERAQLQRDLEEVAKGASGFAVAVAGLRSLGRGVAFRLEAPEAQRLRGELARRWQPWLGPQDSQGWTPHVTVQNKVTGDAARRLLEELQAGFAPFEAQAEGFDLWAYRGGPWEFLAGFPFG